MRCLPNWTLTCYPKLEGPAGQREKFGERWNPLSALSRGKKAKQRVCMFPAVCGARSYHGLYRIDWLIYCGLTALSQSISTSLTLHFAYQTWFTYPSLYAKNSKP